MSLKDRAARGQAGAPPAESLADPPR